eukprot:scaffold115728_cov67-Phaeocystis_antarctica.AAC.12
MEVRGASMFASRMYLFVEFSSSGRPTASLNNIRFRSDGLPPQRDSLCLSVQGLRPIDLRSSHG